LRASFASIVSPSLLYDLDFGVVDTGIELEDLAGEEAPGHWSDKTGTSREARRKEKWNHKLKELADREEMKFSHSIQFNAVPDWSSNYISYSNLKKLYVFDVCPVFATMTR
jgi:hypothetical protein